MDITVAVCTYRRFNLLRTCLESLQRQSVDRSNYRLLVIDNSLQPEESKRFRDSLWAFTNLEYVITEQCGIAFARNEALRRCQTALIAFTDDDCVIPVDWVDTILSEFSSLDDSVAAIGGRVLPRWELRQPDWLEKKFFHQLALIDWGQERTPICHQDGKWLLTANAAYRTNALRKAGGFPMHLGRKRRLPLAQEEFAANQCLLDMGFVVLYTPKLWVEHFIPQERTTKKSLLRDAFWDGVSQALIRARDFQAEDTDVLSGKLMPLQDSLLSKIDESISSSILLEKGNELRGKGFHAAQEVLCDLEKAEGCTETAWPITYIVTPCLNAVSTIDQAILSVITQAGNFAIRYHVQDGGSKDGTLEKLKEWGKWLEELNNPLIQCRNIVFTYKSGPDDGVYDAITKGFQHMDIPSNAAMTWINADDYLIPGALATVQAAFSQCTDVSWIIGATHACTQSNYPFGLHAFAFPMDIVRNGICDGYHWQHIQQEGSFWRKRLWDKVGGLDLSLRYAGDWDLWRRFAHHCRPVQTAWPLGCFKQRSGQLSEKYMHLYNAEIESRVSLNQRQKVLSDIVHNSQDTWIYILVADREKKYVVTKKRLDSESIPGCTWNNCRDLAVRILGQPLRSAAEEKQTASANKTFFHVPFTPSSSKADLMNSSISTIPTWKLLAFPDHSNVVFASGWHTQESDSTGWWRWSPGQGVLHIRASQPQVVSFNFVLNFQEEEDELIITLDGTKVYSAMVGRKAQPIGPVRASIKPGTNILAIRSRKDGDVSFREGHNKSFMLKNPEFNFVQARVDFKSKLALLPLVKRLIKFQKEAPTQ